MKYLDRCFLFVLLLPLSSFAQSNFKPGYVITLKGDTLRGFIDYKEWDKNPVKISFKNNSGDNRTEIFTTENARQFVVSGAECFKRFTVHVSQDQVELASVKQGADTSFITAKVFLRLLSAGKNISLFSYTDKIKTRYYILDGVEERPQELVYRVYYSAGNSTMLQTENRFRSQLEYLSSKHNVKNSTLESKILYSEYQEADLVKIVELINGGPNKQVTPASHFGARWYAGLGAANNNLSFTGVINYANNSNTFPKASAGFDLFPNKNTQRLFLRAELSLGQNQHSFSYGPDASGYSSSLSKIIQQNITISQQVAYNIYNTDRFSIFVDAGIALNVSFYNKYHFTENFSNTASTTTNEFPVMPQKWLSFPLKTGITLNKRIEIYFGYILIESNNDNYQPFTGKIYEYQAGINYLFGIK